MTREVVQTIRVVDEQIDGRHGPVPVRRYRPSSADGAAAPDSTVVWLHGGAFSYGGLDQNESHAVGIALAGAGIPVVAVDYRRVPPWSWWRRPGPGVLDGVRFPVPLDDVFDAVASVHAEGTAFVLGGASAGACLAAAAALRLHAEAAPGPERLLLAYGTFHAELPPITPDIAARIRGRHGLTQFRPGTVERMNRNYAGRIEAMDDPFAFPGGHDLTGLPPTLCLDADRDSLRASGQQFAAELRSFGVAAEHQVVPESTHGFLDRPGTAGFNGGIARAVAWLASGEHR
jgi:acetyl esterase